VWSSSSHASSRPGPNHLALSRRGWKPSGRNSFPGRIQCRCRARNGRTPPGRCPGRSRLGRSSSSRGPARHRRRSSAGNSPSGLSRTTPTVRRRTGNRPVRGRLRKHPVHIKYRLRRAAIHRVLGPRRNQPEHCPGLSSVHRPTAAQLLGRPLSNCRCRPRPPDTPRRSCPCRRPPRRRCRPRWHRRRTSRPGRTLSRPRCNGPSRPLTVPRRRSDPLHRSGTWTRSA
jgi:serine/arginine repetitive matrix protein 2